MKFVDVFQFFNYLLEEMSRCNCFSLQLVGGRLVGRRSEPQGEVCPRVNANFYPKIPAAQYVGDVELLTARTETEEAFGFWVARKLATDFLFPNPQ